MKLLTDYSNIFKRYDLALEVAKEAARVVSKDPIMQEVASFVVKGDDEGIAPAVTKALASKAPTAIISEGLSLRHHLSPPRARLVLAPTPTWPAT